MANTIVLNSDGVPVARYTCPRCGGGKFELVPLGIPGMGTSKCVRCGLPLATWAHDPAPEPFKDAVP